MHNGPIVTSRIEPNRAETAVGGLGAASDVASRGRGVHSSIDGTPTISRRQQRRQRRQLEFRNTVVADDQTRGQLNQQRVSQRAEDFSTGVAEILEMGRTRRWGQARINEAIQRYCQQPTGTMSPTSDVPQPLAASTAVNDATDNVMMP